MSDTTKTCSKCGEQKHINEFYQNRLRCKSCISKHMREYYNRNREQIKSRTLAYYNEYVRSNKSIK